MQSLQHRIDSTQRLIEPYPTESFERAIAGREDEGTRKRLAHVFEVYDDTLAWTWKDIAFGGIFILAFWTVLVGFVYLLTPYIVQVME